MTDHTVESLLRENEELKEEVFELQVRLSKLGIAEAREALADRLNEVSWDNDDGYYDEELSAMAQGLVDARDSHDRFVDPIAYAERKMGA